MSVDLKGGISKRFDLVSKTGLWNQHKENILLDLSSKRWSVIDNFLPHCSFKQLAIAASRDYQEGLLKPATVGKSKKRREKVRGDAIRWVQRSNCHPSIYPILDIIDNLQENLRQQLFLPLQENESHFAVYPPGTFYVKHLDCHRNQNNRILTFILYLNRRNWSKANGGQLRMYMDKHEFVDINPIGNRLVLFDSSVFYHEVLPATRPRMSYTGWMRRNSTFGS
ncbi:2OG-Fe(II) oxygenase [Lentisphaera marina]|uniref:2OG-Fe(II) oxygenase n=1 Tax=Lentisphaera marina TaxID=1111041 RepID=UPI002365BCC6|nr:2OG-Fe(II) oxygenase [Lentisphaera marina]MDD7987437.1 2OG-Fe(II) oxygenase [Lentisphaera marina]